MQWPFGPSPCHKRFAACGVESRLTCALLSAAMLLSDSEVVRLKTSAGRFDCSNDKDRLHTFQQTIYHLLARLGVAGMVVSSPSTLGQQQETTRQAPKHRKPKLNKTQLPSMKKQKERFVVSFQTSTVRSESSRINSHEGLGFRVFPRTSSSAQRSPRALRPVGVSSQRRGDGAGRRRKSQRKRQRRRSESTRDWQIEAWAFGSINNQLLL